MQYNITFPTIIAHEINLEYIDNLLPVAHEYLSKYGASHRNDNHITTYFNADCIKSMASDERLFNFFNYITKQSRIYLNAMNVNSEDYKFDFPFSFFARVGQGSSHETHAHPNSIISGVYYLKCSENTSPIIFTDPRGYHKYIHYKQIFNRDSGYYLNPEYVVNPKPGMLLLFPSWLEHEVPKQTTEDERITIVFNLDK
jgi:uncharacterized protein (TIGR02466 family)